MSQPEVMQGQVWVEMDPRIERYVIVEKVYSGTPQFAKVRRVNADGTAWPKSRSLDAQVTRFNGKRGGYAIHKTAPSGPGHFKSEIDTDE